MPLEISILSLFSWLIIFVAIPYAFWLMQSGSQKRPLVNYLDRKRIADNSFHSHYRWEQIGIHEERGACVIIIDRMEILLYPPNAQREIDFFRCIKLEQLRGFWQVDSLGEIWLDVEMSQSLYTLKLRIPDQLLPKFIQVLTSFATPEQVAAYKANIPYMPRFVSGSEVEQHLTGEWKRLSHRTLYLNPSHLILLNSSRKIEKMISLLSIQDIEAIPRMDEAHTVILRFRAEGELYSFAIPAYEAWVTALAEAASKAQGTELDLEIMELKKKKDEN
jgi:hypothetical protein